MSCAECIVSLFSGKTVRLPLVGEEGAVDLPSFVRRAVALLVADDPDAAVGRVPLAMLVLSNSAAGSPRLGEVVTSTEALREHAEDEPSFTLAVRAAEQATCGVRQCREGLKRRSQVRENGKGYHFSYPVAFMVEEAKVPFPDYTGASVNMMPFVMGDKRSLPEYLHGYWPLICACKLEKEERGKIGYLTVDEKEILDDQTSHRRAGLHTDSPGVYLPGLRPVATAPHVHYSQEEEAFDAFQVGELEKNPGLPYTRTVAAHGSGTQLSRFPKEYHPRGIGDFQVDYHPWGIGVVMREGRRGGIYMASNVDDSTEIFNAIVEDPGMIGHLGSCEHLREFLGPPTRLKAGELCWFSDRTPHESLPLPAGTRRQFFRLVTSQVGVWYPDHSTANPTGVVPDPSVTRVLRGSKFAREPAARPAGCSPAAADLGL